MRRTSLFRNSSPTSGRVLTSRSGGSTCGGSCLSAWAWKDQGLQPGPSHSPSTPYLGLQELPGGAVPAGTLRQHAQHRGHALLQPVCLQRSLGHRTGPPNSRLGARNLPQTILLGGTWEVAPAEGARVSRGCLCELRKEQAETRTQKAICTFGQPRTFPTFK